jgi:uncharacterized Zn finger protein (UPF0148 family)
METVRRLMNPNEHCPECGALLHAIPGGALCPHCGCEVEDPEERMQLALIRLPGSRGEGARFHLNDDLPAPALALDEAA